MTLYQSLLSITLSRSVSIGLPETPCVGKRKVGSHTPQRLEQWALYPIFNVSKGCIKRYVGFLKTALSATPYSF